MRYTGFPPEVKATIRSRAQNLCEICGQHTSDCVAHHRRPRGMGGTRRPESNGAAAGLWLCAMCHHRVESYRYDAFEQGWLVRQSHDPADVSVMRRGVRVYLGDAGEVYPWTPDLRVMP
jgi:5-methylcytosine-specific restriction protein A